MLHFHDNSVDSRAAAKMNFLDTSLTTASPGAVTPPPQAAGQSQPSLNEEVTEVIGQLGRFWGGFRKQVCYRKTPFESQL